MKYLIVSLVFVIGIILGYVLGVTNVVEKTEKLIGGQGDEAEVVYDTIIHTKRIKVPVLIREENSKVADSILDLERQVQDSLFVLEMDSARVKGEEDIVIRREKLIKSMLIPIDFIGTIEEDKDTLLREMMGIKENVVTELMVEFWESPLIFSGYKLSKKKLVLYGLSPQFEYTILKKRDIFYLSYQNIYYILKETQDFLPFKTVKKQVVFHD